MPEAKAADLKAIAYDREAREQLIALTGYTLASWVSQEVLLIAEGQYDTRLARLNVRTRQIRTGEGRETGDNAYAPGGAFYARPNAEFPYMGRGVEVYAWEANTGLAQSIYDGDVMQVAWSPDGRWVGTVTAHGAIVVWPTNLRP